jgi:lysophospholipid acyltransferase (LPLAT)-like uncharacterized protein
LSDVVDRTIYELTGWRRLGVKLVAALYLCWERSIRIEADDATIAALRATDEPVVIALWHNRLFFAPLIRRRYRFSRQVWGLVSASRDGAALAAFFDAVGISCVRGSSSRFGREALSELVRRRSEGGDVAITPDGPRGPIYDFKEGALLAARRCRSPMLLIGARPRSAWRLKSWDRFVLPRPFSTVRLTAQVVPADSLGRDSGARWRELLLELCGEESGQAAGTRGVREDPSSSST